MILGTAGHVDHGKTALVKALTGVDTDRLVEEKRRGITIDLGFAPLRLGDELTLGVVDVPGHEAFVRNMLAGATGVDLALLVVAADEGVMPQTREHLAILTLLGIRGGVVALTKADLVEDDWLELVTEDVRAALAGSPLAESAIVPTSVVSGAGLDALRGALIEAACALPRRDEDDLFRLPVDRAFTIRGTGTVLTGTVWSGSLRRDATVRLLPGGRGARVRGIEQHGAAADRALPGTRAAVAVAGLEVADVHRGSVVVADAGWAETRALLAEVALLDSAPRALGPRTRVRFHLGTADVGARVITAGGPLEPGTAKQARVVLDEPVVARAGDRFVIRSASPVSTIGGGLVGDPLPAHRRARPWRSPARTPAERLERALAEAGAHGLPVGALAVRTGAVPSELAALIDSLRDSAVRVADRLFARHSAEAVARALTAAVDAHHQEHALDAGAPLQSVRSSASADPALVDEVLRRLVGEGQLEIEGALVRRRGWRPTLSASQEERSRALLDALERAGREPPSVAELEASHGPETARLLRYLERAESIVQVEGDRYYSRTVLEGLVGALRARMVPGHEYAPPELREVLGFSRKYLIPFLEYCDRTGITERRAAGRVIRTS